MKTANQASRQVFGRPVGQIAPASGPITVSPDRRGPLDRGALPHYWHPDRDGAEQPPQRVADMLAHISPTLRLTRPPSRAPVPVHCWLLWMAKPSVTHPLCPGWWLLMDWQINGQPLPLEMPLLAAAIYHFDARNFKSAVDFFDRVIAERDRAKALKEKRYKSDLHAQAKEYRSSLKISTAGRGNRFALHHDGTILPSRGELSWTLDNLKRSLPSSVLREQRDQREKARS